MIISWFVFSQSNKIQNEADDMTEVYLKKSLSVCAFGGPKAFVAELFTILLFN